MMNALRCCTACLEKTKAKTLAINRDANLWDTFTQEEQSLVEAFDAGKLQRRLQNLVDEKTSVYRR